MIEWSRVQALTFDCFGTLVDWEQGILRDLKAGLTTRAGKPATEYYADDELLRFYSLAEPAAQGTPFKTYRDVLKVSLLRIADSGHLKIKDPEVLVHGLPTWPVFDDVPEALGRLKGRFKIALVTNCDRDLLAGVLPRLGADLDAVITSADVSAYKPSPRLFEEALNRLGVAKDALVHAAQSLFHDVEPARGMGIATVHVDRRGGKPGGATPRPTAAAIPDLVVKNLSELCSRALV
jgi:2-haloacid dehalogenase